MGAVQSMVLVVDTVQRVMSTVTALKFMSLGTSGQPSPTRDGRWYR